MARRRRRLGPKPLKPGMEQIDTSNWVYATCFVCGNEFVWRRGESALYRFGMTPKIGPFYVCLRCKHSDADPGRRFVQMYLTLKRVAKQGCLGSIDELGEWIEGYNNCKCPPCTAQRLIEDIDRERPRRKLYRKVRKTSSQEVQV